MTQCNREVSFQPNLSPEQSEKNLSALLVRGAIQNSSLNRAIDRLDERFRSYCSFYSQGLWTPGLVITNEMRGSTEQYLPMIEIHSAFRQFFSLALRYPLPDESDPVQGATNWLDLLQRLLLSQESLNPATLLKILITDESRRRLFLFRSLLPKHHGGSFLRYPSQLVVLEDWIIRKRNSLSRGIRCLDAACGSGEGTYDLAKLLLQCGIPPCAQQVHGSSLEPLEVFSAAHGYFPHDPQREKRFKAFVEPLFATHTISNMLFFRDTVMRQPTPDEKPYDIILCNGLLGGPFLHDRTMLENALIALTKRLNKGGIFLATDRFHGGWKKGGSQGFLAEFMKRKGFLIRHGDYGIAAEKI
ncbi:MAG: chemotaxis protein CheR [Geobacteraceae bacterium]